MALFSGTIRKYRFYRLPEAERIQMWPDLGSVGIDVRLTGFPNFGSEPFLISIGSHVTISANVAFVNHDGGARVFRSERPGLHVYDKISVGDHVFIGMGSILLPGVTIGDNCVIGAGSVVSRDVPSGSVAAGVPCRVIKSIQEYREGLERKGIDWPVGQYDESWRSCLIRKYW
ncbi:acyltransferase [Gordonia polyisoprenivorans]|uniref:acyltransferase n=1 Tax=Gordonia polyisoprenivorans TaxID=84595 RepID=UPI0020114ABF|nr:acyltransferase [Gordonia polyisoprenivorans]